NYFVFEALNFKMWTDDAIDQSSSPQQLQETLPLNGRKWDSLKEHFITRNRMPRKISRLYSMLM
ncbi:MAG: hypothetical protein K8R11_12160, partial [Methanococcoides sp.]|nr:hypothetical protein [Methanococcoides sp.]MCD4822779.1 hypothetical protein [Methanococcoides sp.]